MVHTPTNEKDAGSSPRPGASPSTVVLQVNPDPNVTPPSTAPSSNSSSSNPSSPLITPSLTPSDSPALHANLGNISLKDAAGLDNVEPSSLKAAQTLIVMASVAGTVTAEKPPKHWRNGLPEEYVRFGLDLNIDTRFGKADFLHVWNIMRQFYRLSLSKAINAANQLTYQVTIKVERVCATEIDNRKIDIVNPKASDVSKWELLKNDMAALGITLPSTISQYQAKNKTPLGKAKPIEKTYFYDESRWEKFVSTHFPNLMPGKKLTEDNIILQQRAAPDLMEKAVELLRAQGLNDAAIYTLFALFEGNHNREINFNRHAKWNAVWKSPTTDEISKEDRITAIAKESLTWQVLYATFTYIYAAKYVRAMSYQYSAQLDPMLKTTAFGLASSWETVLSSETYNVACDEFADTLAVSEIAAEFDKSVDRGMEDYRTRKTYQECLREIDTRREADFNAACEYFTYVYLAEESCVSLYIVNHLNQEGRIAAFAYPNAWHGTTRDGQVYEYSVHRYFRLVDPKGERARFYKLEKEEVPELDLNAGASGSPRGSVSIVAAISSRSSPSELRTGLHTASAPRPIPGTTEHDSTHLAHSAPTPHVVELLRANNSPPESSVFRSIDLNNLQVVAYVANEHGTAVPVYAMKTAPRPPIDSNTSFQP